MHASRAAGFVAALAATLAAAASPPAPAAPAASPARLEQLPAFESPGLAPRAVSVWLPPGYDGDARRFGVLYMHDGQNLYDGRLAFGGISWGVDQALLALIARGEVPPVIVVGIANTADRFREYLPDAVVRALPATLQQKLRAAAGAPEGEPLGDAYLRFVVGELKPWVDAHYRTLPDARHTAIAGSSMGGLISLYALGEYPGVFGAAAALSTHWPMAMPTSLDALDASDREATMRAWAGWIAPKLDALRGHRLYLDHGTAGLDAAYAPYQRAFDALLPPSGAGGNLQWTSVQAEGAGHNEAAWRARLAGPLRFILASPGP